MLLCAEVFVCVWRVLEVTHTHTHARTLTLKQPNSEIENKCDKAERWKREGGWKRRRVEEREGGRGIRERAADVKIVWREIRKQAHKQNIEKKGIEIEVEIELKLKPTTYLLFCSMLHVCQMHECVCTWGGGGDGGAGVSVHMCVYDIRNWPFLPSLYEWTSLPWATAVLFDLTNALLPHVRNTTVKCG